MTLLEACVTDGQYGPVLVLSGQADLTTLAQLNSALDAQIWAGPRLLTVDLSRLTYADSASIAALTLAARTLRGQGGELELLHPQATVARILSLTGVDQVVTIRGAAGPDPGQRPDERPFSGTASESGDPTARGLPSH